MILREIRTHLLLEVSSLLLVNENQVKVISHGELLVDVPHGGGEVVAREKDADRYRLALDRRAIHDLVPK